MEFRLLATIQDPALEVSFPVRFSFYMSIFNIDFTFLFKKMLIQFVTFEKFFDKLKMHV